MRTLNQLRTQVETQAETIQRLNIDNLRLARENDVLQQILDRVLADETPKVPRAVTEVEQHFTE